MLDVRWTVCGKGEGLGKIRIAQNQWFGSVHCGSDLCGSSKCRLVWVSLLPQHKHLNLIQYHSRSGFVCLQEFPNTQSYEAFIMRYRPHFCYANGAETNEFKLPSQPRNSVCLWVAASVRHLYTFENTVHDLPSSPLLSGTIFLRHFQTP